MTKSEKTLWADLIKKHEKSLNQVWNGNQHMIDYCLKECSAYVPLENGNYITLDKPTIETRFCFGYSLSSHDTEDYDNASDLSMKARKDVDYFMSENLKDFDYRIEQLKDKSNKYGLILRYSGQAKNDSLKSYTFIDDYRYPNRYKDLDYIPLSDNDRKTIIKALEVEKEKFTKRLKTYLKRFGLSKIDTWTYWRDV